MPFPKNSKTKTFYEHKRSFHLIFQAGSSAFLRFAAFFPVVGSVEVSGSFIDRLTNPQNGPISSPQNTRGSAPFFRTSPDSQPRRLYSIIRKVSKKIQEIGKSKE